MSIVNYEEHVLRALADTGASSSIILEAYTSKELIKQVKAILKIKAPKTRKELRRFIGIVSYYCNMWFRRSELLAPLTSLTSRNVKFEWLPSHQQAIDKIKKVIETELLLAYPDFDKPFQIYTDAS